MDDESTRALLADIERRWGRRTRLPPDAIELPREGGVRHAQADTRACAAVKGRWIERPGFDILDARLTGAVPRDRFIFIYIELDIRIRGHLACEGGCSNGLPDTRVAYELTVPIEYRLDTLRLMLPSYIKWLLLLRSVIVSGARLVSFIRDNQELMELLGHALRPTLDIVWNSADLICQGAFDPGALREHIRRQMQQREFDPNLA